MKYCALLTLSLVFYTSYSQVNFDSLESALDEYPSIDSTFIEMKIGYIDKKIFYDPTDTALLSYAETVLSDSRDIGYEKGIALALQKIGIVYQYFKGDPLTAIDYYQEALTVIDANPDLAKYAYSSKANIAHIYYEQKDYEKALEEYLFLYQKFREITIVEQYIANVYGELKQYDSSIYYFKESITRAEKQQNFAILANCLGSLALIYTRADTLLAEAEERIDRSIKLVDEKGLEIIKPGSYFNGCMVYLATGNYNKALEYAELVLEMEVINQNLFFKKSAYATLAEAYMMVDKGQQALEAFEIYNVLNDSLMGQDRKLEVSRKELEFEAKKKELEADAAIAKQDLRNKIYLTSGGFALSLFVIGFVFYRSSERNKSKQQESEFRMNLAESKLVALRSQLNPHFIFNALSSIDNYITSEGPQKASEYLIKSADLMRGILNKSTENWVALEEDLELMKLYVDVESIRLKEGIDFKIDISNEIDASNVLVPPLFLQPFIENSVQHGLIPKPDKGTISLGFKIEADMLICTVSDDGVGLKGELKKSSKGMEIAKSRIDYVNQLTDKQSKFSIHNLDQGVLVTVQLPLKLEF